MIPRIIPKFDIKGPNLVKGIHLEGVLVLGKSERFARYYYDNGQVPPISGSKSMANEHFCPRLNSPFMR